MSTRRSEGEGKTDGGGGAEENIVGTTGKIDRPELQRRANCSPRARLTASNPGS